MQDWQCRWSPTLGELEATHQEVWGTRDYDSPFATTDNPTVFFGIYGLPDFYTLWRHKGRKAILWAGSDITHLKDGYWLDELGHYRLPPKALAEWMNRHCENYCENEVEQEALKKVGIFAKIIPSFLGDVTKFQVTFKPGNKLYTSVSGDNFELYGWNKLFKLAIENPLIEFHCYGNTVNPFTGDVPKNIIVHGRVPKEQMNAEIADMQGALRLTKFDGFSEIIAKSFLMGQYPVSLIRYPYALKLEDITTILDKTEANPARDFYLSIINDFPWNQKK